MSAGNENSDITKSQESLTVSDESAGASSVKEDNVEAQTIDPNQTAQTPQTNGGGNSPAAPRGGGGSGGGGGAGKPGGAGGGKPSSEADSVELFTNWSEFVQFLRETYAEFRKISWPTRQQVMQETWSVIVLVSLLTGLVLCFDWGVAKVVFEPLDKFAKKMGGGVGNTMQNWAPTAPLPGAPTNQPGAPAQNPATPESSPAGKLNSAPVTVPVEKTPSGQSDKSSGGTGSNAPAPGSSNANPSSSAPSTKTEDAKPGDSK